MVRTGGRGRCHTLGLRSESVARGGCRTLGLWFETGSWLLVSSARGATSRWGTGPFRYDIQVLVSIGVSYGRYVYCCVVVVVFDVSRAAHRRARIRASLPTVAPAGFDQINDDIDALPDPELLCAEERAAAMRHTARLRNRIEAYLTGLAGAADTAGDSRVLGAGTTGSLVAIATGSPVAVGSGMVNTANALHDLPVVKDAWAAGSISGLHVYQILAHAPAIDDFTSKQAAIVGLAKLTDASEVRRVLQVAAEADNPTHLDLSLDQQRAKRSCACLPARMGCGRSPGCSTRSTGRSWPKPWQRSPAPGHPRHHHPGPTPRRCPDRHVQGRGGQHHPAGCPRCPSSWTWRTCPPVTTRPWSTAPPGRRFV